MQILLLQIMAYLLKIATMNAFFESNKNLLEKGENSYDSGNVVNVEFDPEYYLIKGKVKASMKSKIYKVTV